MVYETELQHWGIKGQKWGVRRYQNEDGSLKTAGKKRYGSDTANKRKEKSEAYKRQMAKIANNRSAAATEQRYAQYASLSTSKKFTSTLKGQCTGMVIADILTGNVLRYARMSKEELAGELVKKSLQLAGSTAASMATSEVMARSVSAKYDKNGRRKTGMKHHMLTREDAAEIAMTLAPYAMAVGSMTMARAKGKRAANESRVKQWTKNKYR